MEVPSSVSRAFIQAPAAELSHGGRTYVSPDRGSCSLKPHVREAVSEASEPARSRDTRDRVPAAERAAWHFLPPGHTASAATGSDAETTATAPRRVVTRDGKAKCDRARVKMKNQSPPSPVFCLKK